jgi:hypothetical protein
MVALTETEDANRHAINKYASFRHPMTDCDFSSIERPEEGIFRS